MPLVFVACMLAIAWPATMVFDRGGALAFATIVTCWLLLARAIAAGLIGHLTGSLFIGNLAVDVVALAATAAIDLRLLAATAVGIVFSELFYARVSDRGPSSSA